MGAGAMTASSGSEQTTAVGFQAGAYTADADRSVFVGANAGVMSTGARNTYSGYYSGAGAAGEQNVASGNYAYGQSTGSHNIAHGSAAGAAVTGDGNVSIGYRAGAQVDLDAAGDPVSTSPSIYSHAVNVGSNTQAIANEAVAVGSRSQATVDGGVAVGAGATVTTEGGVAIGADSVASREAGAAGYVPPAASPAQASAIVATRGTRGAVAVGDAEAGEYRQITGVAAGSEDSDAVNVAQLKGVSADVANQNQTLHSRIDAMGDRIDSVERGANAGVAAAMAMAGMPQAYLPGKGMLAASVGNYRGETAAAVGISRLSDNGRWVTKLNGSANARGHFGVTVGAGFHW
jgi:autotransporter adhesin